MAMHAAHVPAPMKPGPVVYTDRQLLCVLIRLAQGESTLGRRTFEQRRRDADPSVPLYERRFGSWNRAIELAGLDAVAQPEQLQDATTKWPQEQLIAAIRPCLLETGSTTLAAYETWRTDRADLKGDVPSATELACG